MDQQTPLGPRRLRNQRPSGTPDDRSPSLRQRLGQQAGDSPAAVSFIPRPTVPPASRPTPSPAARAGPVSEDYLTPQFQAVKARVQQALLEADGRAEDQERDALRRQIAALLVDEVTISPMERDAFADQLTNEIKGFGPIQPLLDDETVSEIMINGPRQVFVERAGRLEPTRVAFADAQHLRQVTEKMLASSGRRVDERSPMVDARLPDGSRLNAVIRPIALHGDSVTIRKFSKDPLTLAELVERRTLSAAMAAFLDSAVRGRVSLVVSGGTGSGKTTTLNALSASIPDEERIITIEDAAELQLMQEHKVTLEARPPNIEGQGEISIRSLVRNALRMRPDRILVGEVRGGEALDMLQAMNTGHEGSLTTAHANTPRDCLSRLETMVLMAGTELPLPAIRQQIASAVNLIVQQARMPDGRRRIVQITEVVGMEGGTIVTQDLFVYDPGEDAAGFEPFVATGIRPQCLAQMERNGVEVPNVVFQGRTTV